MPASPPTWGPRCDRSQRDPGLRGHPGRRRRPAQSDAAVAALRRAGMRAVFAYGVPFETMVSQGTGLSDGVRRVRSELLPDDTADVTMALLTEWGDDDAERRNAALARDLGVRTARQVGAGTPISRLRDLGVPTRHDVHPRQCLAHRGAADHRGQRRDALGGAGDRADDGPRHADGGSGPAGPAAEPEHLRRGHRGRRLHGPDSSTAAFPATGRRFAVTQTHWFRIRGGRICEHWANRHDLGMRTQLGWGSQSPLYVARRLLLTARLRRRAGVPPATAVSGTEASPT